MTFLAAWILFCAGVPAGAGAGNGKLFEPGEDEWMDLRGGLEAGFRAVTGKEGRYEQDVNLDGGFRLLSAELHGTSREKDAAVDAFDLSLIGLGDPNRLADVRVRAEDSFDLRFHADRQEYIYRATADPHPWDTTRDATGMSLSVNLSKNVVVRYSQDRLHREGDGRLEMRYRDNQAYPVDAVIDYQGLFHSAGFDAKSGAFRLGGTWSWSRVEDVGVRILDAPPTLPSDRARYLNDSAIDGESAVGRAGWRILGGKVDLSVSGGYHAAETDTRVRGVEAITPAAAPGLGYTDLRAQTEANSRGWYGRGEILVLPHADWEVLGRYERRTDSVLGTADILLRDVPPPLPPAGPFFPLPSSSRSTADLVRTGAEARWRASRQWRLRVGGEEVRERITSREVDPFEVLDRSWNPTTVVATAGADWTPSARVDMSLLARGARARDPATALSTEDGNSLSFRVRARRPDGWHATAFARLKQRSQDAADASSTYDNFGYSMGNVGADHYLEYTISHEDISTAADTRFIVDGTVNPVPTPHRVRYGASVTAFTIDMSQDVGGPFRVFGSLRWADGNGDTPFVQSDLVLGGGWRMTKGAELRLEGRRVAYLENDRRVDDYAAKILTVSVALEF